MQGAAAHGAPPRGRGLREAIPFASMEQYYLLGRARHIFPSAHADWVEPLLDSEEALRAQAAMSERKPAESVLGTAGAHSRRRRGLGVPWERYYGGGGGGCGARQLPGRARPVVAAVECEGWVYTGSLEGTIRAAWDLRS